MNKIIFKKLALIYGALDVLLIIICAYFGALYVLNSQLALICAFLIALASFYGYARRVNVKARQAKISDFDEYFNEDDEIIATNADSTSAGQDNAQVARAKLLSKKACKLLNKKQKSQKSHLAPMILSQPLRHCALQAMLF